MFGLSAIAKSKVFGAVVMGVVLGCVSTVSQAATAKAPTPTTKASKILEGRISGTKISNARYVTLAADGKVSINGYTAKDGSFFYRDGEKISFYVGDILLGTTAAKASVSPVSLVETAKNADALSNMLRFLQTIDTDVTSYNGIQISNLVHTKAKNLKVDFDKAMSSFSVQASLVKLLSVATNSPTLPDAVDALTNFRMSLLTAYDTNSGDTVLNLVNTKWKSTITSNDCPNTSAALTHTFNLVGHATTGYHNLATKKNGTCGGSNLGVMMSLYENDALFSCANGCSMADLNSTVTMQYPSAHQATLIYQPNTNIITIIHAYSNGREVIETLVKQAK